MPLCHPLRRQLSRYDFFVFQMSGDTSDMIVAKDNPENAATSNIAAISTEDPSSLAESNKCQDVDQEKEKTTTTETEEMSEDSEHGGEKKRKSSWTKEKMKKKFSMRSLSFKKKRSLSAAKDSVNSSEDLARPDTEGEELPKPEIELKPEVIATENVEISANETQSPKSEDAASPKCHPKAAEIIDVVSKVDPVPDVQVLDAQAVAQQDSAAEADQVLVVKVPSEAEPANQALDPESEQLPSAVGDPDSNKILSDQKAAEKEEEEAMADMLASVTLDEAAKFAEAVFNEAEKDDEVETVETPGAEQDVEPEKTKSAGRAEAAEAIVSPEDSSPKQEIEMKD